MTELLGHTTSEKIKEDYKQLKKTLGQMLLPKDIARAVLFAYQQPQYVCIREILLAPTVQEV